MYLQGRGSNEWEPYLIKKLVLSEITHARPLILAEQGKQSKHAPRSNSGENKLLKGELTLVRMNLSMKLSTVRRVWDHSSSVQRDPTSTGTVRQPATLRRYSMLHTKGFSAVNADFFYTAVLSLAFSFKVQQSESQPSYCLVRFTVGAAGLLMTQQSQQKSQTPKKKKKKERKKERINDQRKAQGLRSSVMRNSLSLYSVNSRNSFLRTMTLMLASKNWTKVD